MSGSKDFDNQSKQVFSNQACETYTDNFESSGSLEDINLNPISPIAGDGNIHGTCEVVNSGEGINHEENEIEMYNNDSSEDLDYDLLSPFIDHDNIYSSFGNAGLDESGQYKENEMSIEEYLRFLDNSDFDQTSLYPDGENNQQEVEQNNSQEQTLERSNLNIDASSEEGKRVIFFIGDEPITASRSGPRNSPSQNNNLPVEHVTKNDTHGQDFPGHLFDFSVRNVDNDDVSSIEELSRSLFYVESPLPTPPFNEIQFCENSVNNFINMNTFTIYNLTPTINAADLRNYMDLIGLPCQIIFMYAQRDAALITMDENMLSSIKSHFSQMQGNIFIENIGSVHYTLTPPSFDPYQKLRPSLLEHLSTYFLERQDRKREEPNEEVPTNPEIETSGNSLKDMDSEDGSPVIKKPRFSEF